MRLSRTLAGLPVDSGARNWGIAVVGQYSMLPPPALLIKKKYSLHLLQTVLQECSDSDQNVRQAT
jgi:hypothetical protein